MEMKSYGHGVPSWVDVGCRDTVAAAAFYNALFGWDVQPGPPEAGGYAVAHLRGKSVAGLGPIPDPATPPFWLTYVNVDSADEIVDKVTANGGHVFSPPMDVLDFGRMAVFADPMGAVLGAWQPGSHMGAELINEPNTLCWSELLTSDVEASKAFYGAVFGWGAVPQSHSDDVPEAMAYTEWELGNEGHELYDYEKDPREVHNVAAEPATSGIKAQLRDQLHGIIQKRGAKIPG